MSKNKFFVLIIISMMVSVQIYTQNVGISANTFTPDPSALLELKSTSAGLLIPRMTTAERDAISSPAQSLLIFNNDTKCFETYVDGAWKTIWCYNTPSPVTCPASLTVTHTVGSVAPVTKTVTYGVVKINLMGVEKCWITQNLGASNQASSATDATEASAGWYWQFNRKQGYKHDGTTRTPDTTWITSINETSDWTSANDPCTILLGSGWRIPTLYEWKAVDASGGWENYNDTYNSVLKLHAAGYLYYSNGSLYYRGSTGSYWSSTLTSSTNGWYLGFGSGTSLMGNINKASGFPLRCLRD